MAVQNWIPLLRKVFLFSGFPESQLQLIVKKMKLISLPKGAVLFQENDLGDALYIVSRGTLHLTKIMDDGAPATVAYLNRGDSVGEMSILVGDLYPNTAVVDTTAELLSLSKKDFDALLEDQPALAVHLSRLLSSRLATLDRTARKPGTPGKIMSFFPALSLRDQAVFFLNFSVSLLEQTRKKVLLLLISDNLDFWSPFFTTSAKPITTADLDEGALEDRDRFRQFIHLHPSGLEAVLMDETIFRTHSEQIQFGLMSLLKDDYDFTLFVVPEHGGREFTDIASSSNRIFVVLGPERPQIPDLPIDGKKRELIWLAGESDPLPKDITPHFKIPWDPDWGRTAQTDRSPFIPRHARGTHRALGRLARSLGQLLIGMAMGSGAAFGYSLIGILRTLEKEGVFPDIISGTSMGALIGAFYAAGKSPDELEAIARTITRFRLFSQLADFTFPRSGLIKGNEVLKFLRTHLGDRTFTELDLPFSCVATDILSGKEIVLDQGNVAEAVRASLSLPFFFEPAYLDGRYLVDGGLVNPVPTSVVVAQGANILLSANLTMSAGARKVPRLMGWRKRIPRALRGPSISEIMMKTIYTMQYEISATRSGLADVVMHINAPDLLWWDLDKSDNIIKLGEAAAEENIPKIKSMLPFFSDSCRIKLNRP